MLRGKESHELTCQKCGAPIHMMKRLAREPDAREQAQKVKFSAVSHQAAPKKFKKSKKKKRRKSALMWFMEEAKDALEEIFD